MADNNKFDNYIAILRAPLSRDSIMTKWSNVAALRYVRRTESSYKKGKIIRRIYDGVETLASKPYLSKDIFPFKYFPDFRFYAFLKQEMLQISKGFSLFDALSSNATHGQVDDILPYAFPSWFIDFIKNEFPLIDRREMSTEYEFTCQIRKHYYGNFNELDNVTAFFYKRFEDSLSGNLAPEVISPIEEFNQKYMRKNEKLSELEKLIQTLNYMPSYNGNVLSMDTFYNSNSYWTNAD